MGGAYTVYGYGVKIPHAVDTIDMPTPGRGLPCRRYFRHRLALPLMEDSDAMVRSTEAKTATPRELWRAVRQLLEVRVPSVSTSEPGRDPRRLLRRLAQRARRPVEHRARHRGFTVALPAAASDLRCAS